MTIRYILSVAVFAILAIIIATITKSQKKEIKIVAWCGYGLSIIAIIAKYMI